MAHKRKPNVIFMIADDHQHDAIGAFGNATVQTPVLDKLVENGAAFRNTNINGGTNGAVCAPCRACILSGNPIFRATVTQTLDDHVDNITLRPELASMPSTFRDNGYRTFATGKWHNDKASFNRGFEGGEHIFFGGMSSHTSVPVHTFDPEGIYPPEKRRVEETFSSELFTDTAVDFIRKSSEEDRPFFLYVAYTAPHDPRTAPEPFSEMYDPEEIPLPP